MADSGALRQQRYKHHRAGDHHLCHHGPPLAPVTRLPDPDPDDLDPLAEMRKLAGRLAVAYAADTGNAALARELRATCLAIVGAAPADEDPELAGFFESLSVPTYPEQSP